MFDLDHTCRVFGVAPGIDFPKALHDGLITRFENRRPEDLARVLLLVNTRRMARRLRDLFDQGPARLLPQIRLVTELAPLVSSAGISAPVSPLRRRLELIQLISGLLDAQPDLASRASLYDLADSLAALMDEMQGEGVPPSVIEGLDVSDQSGHWQRAKQFIGIAQHFFDDADENPDAEARQRQIVEALMQKWQATPPDQPIILAGSTGSRGTTALLMHAIAKLPQGAIILPGYDTDLPDSVWPDLNNALTAEDHPQYRFHKLLSDMGLSARDVQNWTTASPANPARNRVVSLALRPAPVTDQWLAEGPKLRDIAQAMQDVTLVEADSMREEALVIAMRLREAAENGQTAALISPDRMLTRQVTAALDQWNILPDDSAGTPLQLSPPGRFLRHVSALFRQQLTSEALLTLLKHPLTHTGQDRNIHLLLTRELELHIRKSGWTYPIAIELSAWGDSRKTDGAEPWVAWVISCFFDQQIETDLPLSDLVTHHMSLAESLAHGGPDGSGGLWDKKAGRAAQKAVDELRQNAAAGGALNALDYTDLFGALLSRSEVRDRDAPHGQILIWGTLEARVHGAEFLILGGLNEGSWPEAPSPDPWLSRKMRDAAGLLLPERRIGLAAHDFQQAVAVPEVWITRSAKSDEAETVPSRWINRLTNLLKGLPDQGGTVALQNMRDRGKLWLARVRAFEAVTSVPPATRPSPRPPVAARPKQLSVTEIKRLIRDPYAIFARHVLRLRALDPLMKTPDALLRGIIVHEVLEKFVKDTAGNTALLTRSHLQSICETVLANKVPWPAARLLWQARLDRVSDWFVEGEKRRMKTGQPVGYEARGKAQIQTTDFTLTGVADRIDRTSDGSLIIYDYKTGSPPSRDEQIYFDKQLLLEAAMAEQGAFKDITPSAVADAIYIGLGGSGKEVPAPLAKEPADKVWAEFSELIASYMDQGKGFTSRRAVRSEKEVNTYDQLARFGEWSTSDEPVSKDLS